MSDAATKFRGHHFEGVQAFRTAQGGGCFPKPGEGRSDHGEVGEVQTSSSRHAYRRKQIRRNAAATMTAAPVAAEGFKLNPLAQSFEPG